VAAIATSGVSQMLAMAFANEALRFVSFPTQVLGKSCKMIPVMIGGVVAGRKYPASQYAQVAVVTAGVVAFNLGKSRRVSGGVSRSGAEQLERDSAYGLSLIAASLAMDLVTAALQDRVKTATLRLNPEKKSPKTSMFESMLWTNLGGACAAFCIAAGTGQLASGVSFCARHAAAANNVAFYALASVIGQLFVYFTITEFDPLVLSTVTTTRKIFSTVYSAARSPAAALNKTQWGGCAAVFAAIAWETLEKYRRAQGAKRLGGKKNA
jgi:UDP-galactose transporter B1